MRETGQGKGSGKISGGHSPTATTQPHAPTAPAPTEPKRQRHRASRGAALAPPGLPLAPIHRRGSPNRLSPHPRDPGPSPRRARGCDRKRAGWHAGKAWAQRGGLQAREETRGRERGRRGPSERLPRAGGPGDRRQEAPAAAAAAAREANPRPSGPPPLQPRPLLGLSLSRTSSDRRRRRPNAGPRAPHTRGARGLNATQPRAPSVR